MGRGISIARKTFVSACLSASTSLKPRKGGRGGKCPQGGTEAGSDTEPCWQEQSPGHVLWGKVLNLGEQHGFRATC